MSTRLFCIRGPQSPVMWLTIVMLGKQALPRRMFSGKHRLPRVVNSAQKAFLLRKLVVEEENLFYLRQPFLTLEQEKSVPEYMLTKEQIDAQRQVKAKQKMLKNVSLEERLVFAKVTDAWE